MSLTREDMLRELELLPAWRARLPTAEVLTPVVQVAVVTESIVEIAEQAIEQQPIEKAIAQPVVEPATSVVAEIIDAEPVISTLLQQVQADELPHVVHSDVPTDLIESALPEVVTEPVVQTPWLLYCPQASDAQSQQLLQNIMHALSVPVEDVSLYQQRLLLAQVSTRFCVLFGLAEANRFLATDYAEIDAVRGRMLTYGETKIVVTHDLQSMLENPLLKREVWQDICVLLAEREVAGA